MEVDLHAGMGLLVLAGGLLEEVDAIAAEEAAHLQGVSVAAGALGAGRVGTDAPSQRDYNQRRQQARQSEVQGIHVETLHSQFAVRPAGSCLWSDVDAIQAW